MRASSAFRLPLAATLLAALSVASPAAAESFPYLKYDLSRIGSSQGSSAMTDLPPSPGGPSATQQPKAMQGHASDAPSSPKLMLPSATGVHPNGHVGVDLLRSKSLDRNSPKLPGKPAEFKSK